MSTPSSTILSKLGVENEAYRRLFKLQPSQLY